MRRALVLMLALAYSSCAFAKSTGRGGIFFGRKSLSSDWGELDEQSAWGINLDVKDESWPVWITTAYISSQEEETVITSASPLATKNIEGKTQEFQVGVKKDFLPAPRVRLSIAAGPAYIRAKLGRSVAPYDTATDSALGVWAGADAFVFLGFVVLGAGYHYSHANVDLLGRSLDAGGNNLSFSIGFGW